MNGNATSKQVLTNRLTQHTLGEMRIGPDPRGPSKCLKCHQTFQSGEVWQRIQSPPDPEFGSYFIGVHVQCPARAD